MYKISKSCFNVIFSFLLLNLDFKFIFLIDGARADSFQFALGFLLKASCTSKAQYVVQAMS